MGAETSGQLTNNTRTTAEVIPGSFFTLPAPPTAFNPPGWATATVVATGGNSDVDFYQFTTSATGGALFDIDEIPLSFDTILSLFNSAGTLIAYDDDSNLDPGSVAELDSSIGTITLGPGTYYIAVSHYSNFPSVEGSGSSSALTRPDGGFGGLAVTGAIPGNSSFPLSGSDGGAPYTLHISLQNPVESAAVPEPSSLLVFGGLGCLCLLNSFRRGSTRWRSKDRAACG